MNKYLLVLEYADGGTLNTYLSEHFKDLGWNDKYQLAFQLASAIECIHECDIIHCDLVMINSIIYLIYNYVIITALYISFLFSMQIIYLYIRKTSS